jgi:multidrug efflux pump
LLVVLGVMSFMRLTLRELPAIDPPIVSVEVDYPGASASVVETRITQTLEDALAGIEGINTIESSSRNGASRVSIEFLATRDIEAAANDVRNAVSRVADRMPEEADPPEISKVESDSDADHLAQHALGQHGCRCSCPTTRSATSPIASPAWKAWRRCAWAVSQRYAMRIWLEREASWRRADSPRRRRSRVARGERGAAGRPHRIHRPRLHPARGSATTPAPRISPRCRSSKGADGYVVRLGDVAKVELESSERRRSYLRSNGEPNVGLGIVKTSTANSLDVAA